MPLAGRLVVAARGWDRPRGGAAPAAAGAAADDWAGCALPSPPRAAAAQPRAIPAHTKLAMWGPAAGNVHGLRPRSPAFAVVEPP